MKSHIEQLKKRLKGLDLDNLLEEIQVIPPGMTHNHIQVLEDWHAVTTDDGIVAYFSEESDAFRYRLDLINQILNT